MKYTLIIGDSRNMKEVPSESVHFAVTSPAYFGVPMWSKLLKDIGAEYIGPDDERRKTGKMKAIEVIQNNKKSEKIFHDYLAETWKECWRVLVPQGRLAVNVMNVNNSTHGMWFNTDEVRKRMFEIGFVQREEIIWLKKGQQHHSPMGSSFFPWGTLLTNLIEHIMVFQKPGKRDLSGIDKEKSRLTWKELRDWTDCNVWTMKAASARTESHIAPFPIEIPTRLIKLYSFIGDTILDPYVGCYDRNTEVLTDNGFKLFKNIGKNDKIATLNQQTFHLEYQKPVRFFKQKYNGNMIHFNGRSISLLVTPNHNMFLRETHKKKYMIMKADEMKYRTYRVPIISRWIGKKIKYFVLPSIKKYDLVIKGNKETEEDNLWIKIKSKTFFSKKEAQRMRSRLMKARLNGSCNTFSISKRNGKYKIFRRKILKRYDTGNTKILINDWLKFFGIWIAEGCVTRSKYQVLISQTNKKNIYKIKKILDKLPFKYHFDIIDKEKHGRFKINNKQLYNYLKIFGKSDKKFIPSVIKNLPVNQLKILYNFMMMGDGLKQGKTWNYWTVSKRLSDDVSEIILKCGWNPVIRKIKKKNNPIINGRMIMHKKVCYEIYRSISKERKIDMKNNKKIINYNGYVYCCEVPNHVIFVRRNGRCVWCGNSGTTMQAAKLLRRNSIGYDIDESCVELVKRKVGFDQKSLGFEDEFEIIRQGVSKDIITIHEKEKENKEEKIKKWTK
jgi:DNA modification methylase